MNGIACQSVHADDATAGSDEGQRNPPAAGRKRDDPARPSTRPADILLEVLLFHAILIVILARSVANKKAWRPERRNIVAAAALSRPRGRAVPAGAGV